MPTNVEKQNQKNILMILWILKPFDSFLGYHWCQISTAIPGSINDTCAVSGSKKSRETGLSSSFPKARQRTSSDSSEPGCGPCMAMPDTARLGMRFLWSGNMKQHETTYVWEGFRWMDLGIFRVEGLDDRIHQKQTWRNGFDQEIGFWKTSKGLMWLNHLGGDHPESSCGGWI